MKIQLPTNLVIPHKTYFHKKKGFNYHPEISDALRFSARIVSYSASHLPKYMERNSCAKYHVQRISHTVTHIFSDPKNIQLFIYSRNITWKHNFISLCSSRFMSCATTVCTFGGICDKNRCPLKLK